MGLLSITENDVSFSITEHTSYLLLLMDAITNGYW